MRRLLLGLLLVTVVGLGNAGVASAQDPPPPCGTVTRTTTLTSDCTGPLVVSASGITVNLNGHTVSCEGSLDLDSGAFLATVGISIANRTGVIVRDGTVTHCGTGIRISAGGGHSVIRVNADAAGVCQEGGGPEAPGIRIEGSDENTIRDGSASGNGGGIRLAGDSDRNVVNNETINHNCGDAVRISGGSDRNVVTGSELVGTWGFGSAVVVLEARENTVSLNRIDDTEYREGGAVGILAVDAPSTWIRGNTVTRSETSGIAVYGASPGSVVRENTATENAQQGGCGISVRASRTTVRGNTASRNGFPDFPFAAGICLHAGATGNVVRHNTAVDNKDYDLVDENPGCDANAWSRNRFGTANQACID